MTTQFDEELFEFVHEIIPNISTTMFSFIKCNQHESKLILMPLNDYYFPWWGNKGITDGYNRWNDYKERKFYTIGIKPDGWYEIVYVHQIEMIELNPTHYVTNTVESINCGEFYDRFATINTHLDLLKKDKPKRIELPKITEYEYCRKAISLMRGKYDRKNISINKRIQ